MNKEEIQRYRILNKLKTVYRATSLIGRNESTADHSWSCLILADLFLTEHPELDRLKVYEHLMYHDIVEIEAGDTDIMLDVSKEEQKTKEREGFEKLKKDIPIKLRKKYEKLYDEFEEGITIEARFAKAIDYFEPIINELDHKNDWKEWSEELLRKRKQKKFEEFPIIMQAFEDIIEYLKDNKYFGK